MKETKLFSAAILLAIFPVLAQAQSTNLAKPSPNTLGIDEQVSGA